MMKIMSAEVLKFMCDYFGLCGGCQFDDYSESFEDKKKFLKNLFNEEITLNEAIKKKNYRNRIDFIYFDRKLGLRKKGKWDKVVDIEECDIFDHLGNKTLKEIRKFVFEIPEYDIIKQRGYLNYVVIRTGFDQVMVNFVIKQNEDLIKDYLSKFNFDSVYLLYNNTKSDVSTGEIYKNYGEKYILTKIKDKKYFIGPRTFFQTNKYDVYRIFDIIREHVYGSVIDLYAGVGTIGIYVSDNCSNVVCYELNPESVEIGKENVKLNDCDNVEIYQGNVKDVDFPKGDVLIVDPNRPGLGKKVIKKIFKNDYSRIIYMSCNPITQKQDLELLKNEYKITFLEGFDLFPYTKHVETLCIMDKK